MGSGKILFNGCPYDRGTLELKDDGVYIGGNKVEEVSNKEVDKIGVATDEDFDDGYEPMVNIYRPSLKQRIKDVKETTVGKISDVDKESKNLGILILVGVCTMVILLLVGRKK